MLESQSETPFRLGNETATDNLSFAVVETALDQQIVLCLTIMVYPRFKGTFTVAVDKMSTDYCLSSSSLLMLS